MADLTAAVADGVALLTLNRPERRNAYTAEMGALLNQAYRQCDEDDQVRAIVLTGAGTRSASEPISRWKTARSTLRATNSQQPQPIRPRLSWASRSSPRSTATPSALIDHRAAGRHPNHGSRRQIRCGTGTQGSDSGLHVALDVAAPGRWCRCGGPAPDRADVRRRRGGHDGRRHSNTARGPGARACDDGGARHRRQRRTDVGRIEQATAVGHHAQGLHGAAGRRSGDETASSGDGGADAREGVEAFLQRRVPRWSGSVSKDWKPLPEV